MIQHGVFTFKSHTRMHASMRTNTLARKHARTHTRTQIRTHTRKHARTHAHKHANARPQIHTRTCRSGIGNDQCKHRCPSSKSTYFGLVATQHPGRCQRRYVSTAPLANTDACRDAGERAHTSLRLLSMVLSRHRTQRQ